MNYSDIDIGIFTLCVGSAGIIGSLLLPLHFHISKNFLERISTTLKKKIESEQVTATYTIDGFHH